MLQSYYYVLFLRVVDSSLKMSRSINLYKYVNHLMKESHLCQSEEWEEGAVTTLALPKLREVFSLPKSHRFFMRLDTGTMIKVENSEKIMFQSLH